MLSSGSAFQIRMGRVGYAPGNLMASWLVPTSGRAEPLAFGP